MPSRGAAPAAEPTGPPVSRRARSIARGVSPELAAAAARLARAPDRGRVIADGPVAAAALSRLARKRPVIYNAHNFESGFRHELGGTGGMGGARGAAGLRARAAEAAQRVVDGQRGRPGSGARAVPDGATAVRTQRGGRGGDRTRAPLPGRAARDLRGQLRLRAQPQRPALPARGGAPAGVGTSCPTPSSRWSAPAWSEPPPADPRVEALGFVEDLRAAYARAGCAVVPLLQGGGTPLKLIEALAYGLPVVATPRAVAGLAVRDGEHCLVADGAEAFAEALISVLREGAPSSPAAGGSSRRSATRSRRSASWSRPQRPSRDDDRRDGGPLGARPRSLKRPTNP